MRGSIEEAEELQDDNENERRDDDDRGGGGGEEKSRSVKPASRERQKELLGRLPPTDRQRGARQMDYSPYESKNHSQQQQHGYGYDNYDDY